MNIALWFEIYLLKNIKNKIMKPRFYVGQEVYCSIYGEGVITGINSTLMFSIHVKFAFCSREYNNSGCITIDANPTLIPRTEKFPREIFVTDIDGINYTKRNCLFFYKGKAIVENYLKNGIELWDFYKEIQDEKIESIIKEIEQLDSEQIKELLSRIS